MDGKTNKILRISYKNPLTAEMRRQKQMSTERSIKAILFCMYEDLVDDF
jgi:hypothetical protein